MKIFTKNNIARKIMIAIVIVILFNFIAPNISKADDDEDWGGVLFTPIQGLLLGLGDATMYITAATLSGEFKTDNIITLSTDSTKWYVKIAKEILLNHAIIPGLGATIKALDQMQIIDAPKEIVPDKVDLPLYVITPEKIFANEVPFLDVNIINPNYEDTAASKLQGTVGSWYLALRNLAIIGMLSILVYVGIRILLSSTATDKAKYKGMIKDWVIAICLLFFMHYIMSFTITMVEELTKSLKANSQIPVLQLDLTDYDLNSDQKEIVQKVDELSGGNGDMSQIKWATDFTGIARFRAQLDYDLASGDSADYVAHSGKARMAYTLIYAVLVIYTIMFVFQYLKRLIYIIFLTMIAPLVALTYPIDKMNDGTAQAFNTWLKEYIFNLLLQPFHLLIYSMLIGSAIELATDHLIYTLAVLGFMLPAEKVLRKFFGFEKASAGSSIMSGVVGGQLVMNAIGSISNRVKGGTKKQASGGSNGDDGKGKVRMSDRTADDAEKTDAFLMSALGGGTTTSPSPDPSSNTNANEQDEIKKKLQEEGFTDSYSAQKAKELGIEGDNKKEQYEEARKQREEEIRKQLREQQEEEKPKEEVKQPANTSAFTRPSKKKGKFTRAVGAAMPIVGRGMLATGKGIAKAYGAATVGAIGVAAGLASEDYSNVGKFGAAGAAAGSAITEVAINKGKILPSTVYRKTTAIKDEYMRNLYKEDPAAYKAYMNDQADKAFMRDKEVQLQYKNAFGTKEIDNGKGQRLASYRVAMQKAKEYRKHGVTDNEVIIKAMKANVKGVGDWDSGQRIAAAKYASQVSNEKDIETMSKRLKERGIGQQQIATQEDMLRQIKGLN